ncbi:hypothetical protein [Rothia aeria]|uniref:hypothetical protein n=1 Tax=Rothia aeria TaxID=172042 RepID=UPI0028D10A28|nr:hypothetical protein [Rothia aeria]
MAEDRPRGLKAQVKGPLIIAAALALAAFFAVFVFATGGTHNKPNIGLALGVAGAVFIVTLVVCATLILVDRPNDPSLGQGTGINRSSAELYARAKAKREAAEREKAREQGNSQAAGIKEETAENDAEPPKTTDS